jgi:hypothetical protein
MIWALLGSSKDLGIVEVVENPPARRSRHATITLTNIGRVCRRAPSGRSGDQRPPEVRQKALKQPAMLAGLAKPDKPAASEANAAHSSLRSESIQAACSWLGGPESCLR